MVSFQSGGIKDAKTLQSRLVATLAALSTLGDAPSRPTKVLESYRATSQVQPHWPAALWFSRTGVAIMNEQSGRADRNYVSVT
jgi:hypothetical protein